MRVRVRVRVRVRERASVRVRIRVRVLFSGVLTTSILRNRVRVLLLSCFLSV
jgi:hypothetical protein